MMTRKQGHSPSALLVLHNWWTNGLQTVMNRQKGMGSLHITALGVQRGSPCQRLVEVACMTPPPVPPPLTPASPSFPIDFSQRRAFDYCEFMSNV